MSKTPRPAGAKRKKAAAPPAPGGPAASEPGGATAGGQRDHLLRSLFELSRDLTVTLDLFDTTDLLLYNLMGQVGTSQSSLWLTSEHDAVLAVVRCHGFNRRLADGAIIGCQKELLLRLVERSTRPGTWMAADELPKDRFKLIHQANIALVAPLKSHGELIGWIALGRRVDGSAYSREQLDVLETALGLIGMALENTRLFNRMCEANRGLTTANEHLKEMDRLKTDFLNNMNHELRTPLTVVQGAIECVLERTTQEPATRRLLETALECSCDLGAIIENVVLWTECAHDRVVITLEEGDVRSVIEFVSRTRLPGITEDLRELQVEIADPLLLARFDRARLQQILNELLDNAVKFTPRGTRLRIRGYTEKDDSGAWVQIDVEDNGPGIPADRLESLFRSFEQVDGSMTRRAGGLGLGLALAHGLAERMGGSLGVTSRVGAGTTFTLRLAVAGTTAATGTPGDEAGPLRTAA